NPDPRLLLGASEQDRFEIDLVDAMWRLGRRPACVGPLRGAVSVSPRRNWNPRQFAANDRGAIGAVVWKIGGQTTVPHPADDAKTAKDLHRACGDVVALDTWRLAGPADFGHNDVDAARGQIHRRRQSNRSGAYDKNLGLYFLHRFSRLARSGCPLRATLNFIPGRFGWRNILQVRMVQ